MKKFYLTFLSGLLAFGMTVPVQAKTTSSASSGMHTKHVTKKKPSAKGCTVMLMCVKGKTFACINGKPKCVTAKGSSSSASSMAALTTSVSIQNSAFSPKDLTVTKGTTVTWTNMDSIPHTVKGNGGPSSPSLSQNQSYSYTFKTAGTFSYHCSVHPKMTASVTVK